MSCFGIFIRCALKAGSIYEEWEHMGEYARMHEQKSAWGLGFMGRCVTHMDSKVEGGHFHVAEFEQKLPCGEQSDCIICPVLKTWRSRLTRRYLLVIELSTPESGLDLCSKHAGYERRLG